jgi:paraquat-inducible protein A
MPSLWKDAGRPALPVALLLAGGTVLAIGLTLPVVTLRSGLAREAYSVLGGIRDLARSGEVLLAGIVLGFSVLFPIAKLGLLTRVLFRPVAAERRARLVRTLERLGRWSMLDVFVIAILIGSVHLGVLSEASAERGIHVFGSGILLSMMATVSVQRLLGTARVPQSARLPPAGRAARWTSLLALLLFLLGLALPLMVVEKFRFWDHEYSVLGASGRMWREGEHALALVVVSFVVLLPLARLVGLVLVRWMSRPERLLTAVLRLDEWAMLDVFGLALLVVVSKIGAVASVETRLGFWVILAAAALSFRDSWTLRSVRYAARCESGFTSAASASASTLAERASTAGP